MCELNKKKTKTLDCSAVEVDSIGNGYAHIMFNVIQSAHQCTLLHFILKD